MYTVQSLFFVFGETEPITLAVQGRIQPGLDISAQTSVEFLFSA